MTGVFMKGWISLHVDYSVFAEVTEFRLGGYDGPEIVATERGLETLLTKGAAALAECVRVPPSRTRTTTSPEPTVTKSRVRATGLVKGGPSR